MHELGHNLSLGHADWVHCNQANPAYWGDRLEVALHVRTGRSGCHGIRCQWCRWWRALEPGGNKVRNLARIGLCCRPSWRYGLHILTAVRSNSGLRSVVIEDPYFGDRFFVEFRNFTGEDSQFVSFGCGQTTTQPAAACVWRAPRAFECCAWVETRRSNWVSRRRHTSLGAGRWLWSSAELYRGRDFLAQSPTFGVHVKVSSIASDGSTATIRVTRPAEGSKPMLPGRFQLDIRSRHKSGDVWTAMVGQPGSQSPIRSSGTATPWSDPQTFARPSRVQRARTTRCLRQTSVTKSACRLPDRPCAK